MRQFVESLARLYAGGRVDNVLIQKLLSDNKIDSDEARYILSYSVDSHN